MSPRHDRRERALCDADFWFALGDHVDHLEAVLESELPRIARLARRSALARSVATAWLGRRYGLVVANWGQPGRLLALWVLLLCGRRRLVLLHFHTHLAASPRFVDRLRFGLVQAPLFRASLRCVQALSLYDEALYRRRLGFSGDRLVYIPYPWRRRADTAAVRPAPGGRRVMASGYARCDWDTLFAAARGADWELTVVCGPADLAHVRELNASGAARVECDIPPEAHTELLRTSDVYVIPVLEAEVSTGHVRLRDANEHSVPVVAAGIHALQEYIADGETGLLYAPGVPAELRRQVDALLDDPALAGRVAARAVERSREWDQSDVFVAQRTVVERLLGHATDPTVRIAPASALAAAGH